MQQIRAQNEAEENKAEDEKVNQHDSDSCINVCTHEPGKHCARQQSQASRNTRDDERQGCAAEKQERTDHRQESRDCVLGVHVGNSGLLLMVPIVLTLTPSVNPFF